MKLVIAQRVSLCLKRMASFALVPILLAPVTAKADTVYTSLSAFNAATSGNTTVTFNGIAPAGSFVSYGTSATISGLNFSSNAGSTMFVIDPAYYGFSYTGGGFLSVDYASPHDILTISLPSVTAVAFDFGGLLGSTSAFAVTLSDGFSYAFSTTGSTAGGSLGFIGFTSSTPLNSITITMPDSPDYNAIDNLAYGQAAVPEPGTFGLLLTGLAGGATIFRRRFQN